MLRSMHRIDVRILIPLLAVLLLPAAAAFGAAPVLTVPSAQTVSEGALLTFSVSATDADGQTVDLRASNLPGDATFVDNRNNTGSFSWTPTFFDAGFYVVFFLADDTFGGTDNKNVQIEVVNANNPPELNPIGDRTVDPGASQFIMIGGSDADDDPLTLGVTGLPAWASFTDFGNGFGSLTLAPPPPTPPGTHSLTATLSDGMATDSETFTVTVTGSAPQSPPTLSPIGSQTVAEGASKSVSLSATDPDGGSLVWSVSLPGFANLTPTGSGSGSATARLDLTPGYCQSGIYQASVAISDGSLQDSESFTITVTNVNRSPVWASATYQTSLPEAAAAQLEVSATDPDEACGLAAPALTLFSSDAGAALSSTVTDHGDGTATLSLSASATGAGVYHLNLRAADTGGQVSYASVTVTVTNVEVPLQARAWSESDPIKLHTGKPTEWTYLEPVNGSFSLSDVNLATLKLYAWEGAGSVPYIQPLVESLDMTRDRDQNGVLELRMDYAKLDLRALFSNLVERTAGHLTLKAQLMNGAQISTVLNVDLFPEPNKVIRKIGPNPLNPQATITVAMPHDGRLRVRVFDLRGRLVRTVLDSSYEPAGDRDVQFNGRDERGMSLASGRYYVQVETSDRSEAMPLTILK